MLHLHRADRADRLIGALAAVLAQPPADPFAPEVISVPTRGVERWLTQQLSSTLGATTAGGADGICANVAFPTPRRLVDEAVAAGSGVDPERDPWLPARTVWPLLEVVDEHLAEPWLRRLQQHLEPGRGDRSRRLRTVQHLATLFDRYAVYRPQMLAAWHAGDDVDASATGTALPEHERWQAELWRRLRARIGTPGPAERLQVACRELVVDPDLSDLPARIALFGLTSLPARHLDVLGALAEGGRDIHLFLLQPSDASWQGVQDALARDGAPTARGHAAPGFLPANPLLASWGRDARELQMTLARPRAAASDHHHGVAPAPGDGRAPTLLQRLQDDVRADRAPAPPPAPVPADTSLQIHACHGANRQVDVLRDAILHALEDDPTLEPRDVIVMCPDIETFAPLIQAAFGAGQDAEDGDPAAARTRALRVRLADRSLRETNPILGVVARLLELTAARATASEVLDLADREPIRHRFRFAQDDMSRLEDWVAASGTRWGFDARHREAYNLAGVAQGTWDAGLDRLLTGVALTEDEPRLLAGVVPLDDVDSATIDLAGRFAEYVERLEAVVDDFSDAKTIDAWVAAIAEAADTLTSTSAHDAWQRAELQRIAADVHEEAIGEDGTSPATTLDAADVTALLETRLAGRPTRANFRTGHLTVCTLQPMRSVPHRVVCLLGLDDTVFPRRSPRDGDDLLIAAPHVGDRDARSEDRQILLDALLAATDRLIITYTGNDERTNAERAPAVPVAELLDLVERTGGRGTREAVVVRHPLQPFDRRNFEPGGLIPGAATAWSFDETTLAGARAMASDRPPAPPFLAGPLPPAARDLIELEDVIAFLGHPVRAFLRQRLGIGAGTRADEIDDALPIDVDFRAQWAIGDRLLRARLLGADPERARAAERARGALPPGAIGGRRLALLGALADAIYEAARQEITDLDAERHVRDVRVTLGDARHLGGTVSGLSGDVVQLVTFSRVSAQHRLGAWARVLALTAACPERRFSAVTVGRARRSVQRYKQLTVARIPPVAGATADERRAAACAELAVLVDLYDRGMREPLPLYCETSAAFAAADNRRTAVRSAAQQWTTAFGEAAREDVDADHVRVLGGIRTFDELLEEAPRPDETGEAWGADEPSRLGRYAHRLWARVLAVEEVGDR